LKEVNAVSRASVLLGFLISVFVLGFWLGKVSTGSADMKDRVFELRYYTTEEGKMDALLARFRDHTTRLFEKHGMTNIGYWKPMDGPASQNTLIYLLAHPSREAAEKAWEAFRNDPEWIKVKQESEVNGPLVKKAEPTFLKPTDFSKLK
jgi:hypothetical protein